MIDRNSPFLKTRHFRATNFAHLDSSERLIVTTILFGHIISKLHTAKHIICLITDTNFVEETLWRGPSGCTESSLINSLNCMFSIKTIMKVIFWKGNNSAPSAFTNYRRYDWNVQVFPFYMDIFLKLKVYILIFLWLQINHVFNFKILYVFVVQQGKYSVPPGDLIFVMFALVFPTWVILNYRSFCCS